jgi:hypothetical protein
MSNIVAWLSIIISSFSLLATISVTYIAYFRQGTIVLSKPVYIGARQLTQNEIDAAIENRKIYTTLGGSPKAAQDLVLVPLSVITTGARPRVLRFKLILNDEHVYHGNFELNVTGLSALNNPASFLLPASGNTVLPRQVFSKILCFSQRPLLTGLADPPTLDLWYEEMDSWHPGFRIKWLDWPTLKESFDHFGYISTSENFEFETEFTPEYDLELLRK